MRALAQVPASLTQGRTGVLRMGAPVVRKSFSARARPRGGAAKILRPPFAHIIRCRADRAICFPTLA